MKQKISAVLMVFLLLPSLVLAEVMTVTFSGTEMRSAPHAMTSKIIATVEPSTPLTVLEKQADYYKVSDYRGRTGWVHRSLLGTAPGIVVTGDQANVRQGPGINHPVTFQLSKGMAAQLLDKQDKWVHVRSNDGKEGWIADFLVWGD